LFALYYAWGGRLRRAVAMGISLKLQKRLAASVLNCGVRKVWMDPNECNEISMANSRACPRAPATGVPKRLRACCRDARLAGHRRVAVAVCRAQHQNAAKGKLHWAEGCSPRRAVCRLAREPGAEGVGVCLRFVRAKHPQAGQGRLRHPQADEGARSPNPRAL
jgi:hypothetical protein